MQYFKPSDICTVECTVNNVARSGAAFAIDEGGDSVYIPVNIASRERLDVGDALTCYCIDQTLDENKRADVTARYRAIRVKVDQRLGDVLPGFAASDAMAIRTEVEPEPPVQKEFTLDEARIVIGECFKKRRAWTTDQLISEVIDSNRSAVITSEMKARITGWLVRLHDDGIISSCEVRARRGDEPKVYYSPTLDILIELVDDYELEAD
jgi:hypothetical protein